MSNVLVIDDENSISELLRQVLTLSGYSVKTASGGQEGLQLFKNELFDLVITDILMPDIDGHEVARHIRSSDRPLTPIIAMSGTPWLLEGDEFDSVFSKPFSIHAIVDVVNKITLTAS